RNSTILGIWHDFGARYGSTTKRNSHYAPFLIDELSDDVFSYQRQFVTGSIVNTQSHHEEAQTQMSYSFKASYFRFSGMLDPYSMLLGSNYFWTSDDLKPVDTRLNDLYWINLGFDYGKFGVTAGFNGLSVAAQNQGQFFQTTMSVSRFALFYHDLDYVLDVIFSNGGHSAGSDFSGKVNVRFNMLRFNFYLTFLSDWQPVVSVIHRTLAFTGNLISLESNSKTLNLMAHYKLTDRIYLGGYSAFEQFEAGSFSEGNFKLGLSTYFYF
ncbi:MAG: hypothetical protein NZ480_06540, partial [Bdellovibrionaceae bacterium]|nr:hypothetical protein [Pseudobdellovibrionaceae bacterium]